MSDLRRGGASWLRVSSSNLDAVIWYIRRETGGQRVPVLGIRFRSGKEYFYPSCPESLYKELLAAPSKGVFHARHIKPRWPKGTFEGPE